VDAICAARSKQKPFGIDALAAQVRALLDTTAGGLEPAPAR
jgi:hypothetical protein